MTITKLWGTGVGVRYQIIAVAVADAVSINIVIRFVGGNRAITIVVESVAELGGSRIYEVSGIVTIVTIVDIGFWCCTRTGRCSRVTITIVNAGEKSMS